MIRQDQYNVLRQPTRRIHMKISLINENDVVVDSFDGIAIGGSVSIDGKGTYRRHGNLVMLFDNKYNLLPSPSSKIWFNKRIGVHVGVESYAGNIEWFNMGRFAIESIDLNFNPSEQTITCQMKDYMSFLDGTLGGTLSHKTVIKEGTPISQAIMSVLTGLVKISVEDIRIDDMELALPYTIEKDPGSTVYDLIKEILEIYIGWDYYFNEDGVFVVEKMRDRKSDPVIEVFDSTEKDFTLNSSLGIDFKNVKNSVWVWGRQLDDGRQIKWVYRNRWARPDKKDLSYLTDKQDGDICYIENENKSYVYSSDKWELLDFNVISQFNIESIGEKTWVYSSDEIFDTTQAKLRAEYELQDKSNMAEVINFNCVPLYNLQVNNKIYINNQVQGECLINDITIPLNLDSSMTINSSKIYY